MPSKLPKKSPVHMFAKLEKLAKLLEGIPVWEVYPGSGAALAGVRFGDIIVRVNGVSTPTFEKFLAAGEEHLSHLEFEVFRDGKLMRLSTECAAANG
jgi:S1-C subfamily serine protease